MEDHGKKFQSDVEVCGPFQICLSGIVCTFGILGGWSLLMPVFLIYDPGWTCVDPSGDNNLSFSAVTTDQPYHETIKDAAISPNSSTEDIDLCNLAKSCPSIAFDPETSTIVTEWTFICDKTWIPSLIVSIQMLGIVIGTVMTGYCGDKFGRKVAIYTCIGVSAVMNAVIVFSVSWQMFAFFQFIIGLSAGGTLSLGFIYHLEFVTSQWRLCLNIFPLWDSGMLMFGVVVWLLRDWRNIHIATSVFAGLIFLSIFWVPESLKWLTVQGKTEQAEVLVKKIYKMNGKPCPPDHLIDFTGTEGSEMEKRTSFLLLFKRQVIKRTILSTAIMMLHSVIYNAIAFGIQSFFGDFYINLICYLAARIPAAVAAPCVANKLGRRLSCLVLIAFAALFSFAVAVVFFTVTDSEVKGITITALAFASSTCIGLSWGVLTTYFAEIFPTTIRSMGYSFAYTGARVGAIVTPFCNPQSPDLLYIPYLGMGFLSALCCAMLMSLPETKGQSLENTMSKGRARKVEVYAKDGASDDMLCLETVNDTIT